MKALSERKDRGERNRKPQRARGSARGRLLSHACIVGKREGGKNDEQHREEPHGEEAFLGFGLDSQIFTKDEPRPTQDARRVPFAVGVLHGASVGGGAGKEKISRFFG